MRIVRVNNEDALLRAGIPFKRTTLYKWHSTGQNTEIFIKIAGALCIDLDVYEEWVKKSCSTTKEKAKRLEALRR